MNYYHCSQCTNIPSIETINDDNILIECKFHKEQKIKIIDFINNCIQICSFQNCNNIPKYLINEEFFSCENCFQNLFHSKSKNNINKIFFLSNIYCSKHKNLLNYYCLDCEESKCENCKKEDIKNNHNYLKDEIKNKKKQLDNFIKSAEFIIKEIKDILEKMENELQLYKRLFDNSIITNEIKNNIQKLKITKNIENKAKIFFEKMNEMKNELKNFANFEYITNNISNNKDYKNDNNNNNNNLNKSNNSKINITTMNNNNNINSNLANNGYKKPTIKNTNTKPSNNDNIKSFGYNRENEINQKNKTNIKGDDEKIFQKPKNKLIQNYSLKLTDLSNKNHYIIQKIEEISNNIEDKLNLNERNKYLISIATIAREADNYSKQLCEILIQKFYKEYDKFSSIIYDKAKTELSSWVYQSLIIEKSNEDIKDLRYFYNYYCQKENKRIQKYLTDSDYNSILNEHNFNLEKLFRFLSQLYTEVLLFSDKNIYLKYTEKCDFSQNIMKDITDLNGKRFVMFSVLPGLFVNESNIRDGKILVFCDKNKNSDTKYKINFENIKKYELYLMNTITKLDIEYSVHDKKYHIKIKCEPQIPKIKNLKFTLKLVNSSNPIISGIEKTEFFLEEKYNNKNIYATVEINQEIIKSKEIKLENK